VVVDAASGETLAQGETVVVGTGGNEVDATDEDGEETTTPDDSGAVEESGGTSAPGAVQIVCPEVVYSGRLAPVRISGDGEVVVEASLGGWPDEPGNRRFDAEADGGPDLSGSPPEDVPHFLHWRAPDVRTIVEATIRARAPEGDEIAACRTDVRPGPPPPLSGEAQVGDGTGGPRPNGPVAAGVGGVLANADLGDGSGGPDEGSNEGDPAAEQADASGAADGTDPTSTPAA
jgi:hypothetical protein